MTFSVIIPLYNKRHTLIRCLKSIFAQTFQDFEIVVVNDGSTDDSPHIARDYLRPHDRLIHQANGGVSSARNRGILEAKGRVIAFLDADDEWDPGFLAALAALESAFPEAGMLGTGHRVLYGGNRQQNVTLEGGKDASMMLVTDYFRRSARTKFIWTGCVALRREALEEVGGFPLGVSYGEDLDLWARVAIRYPVAFDSRILSTYYRCVEGQATGTLNVLFYDYIIDSLKRLMKDESLSPSLRNEIGEYLDDKLKKKAYLLLHARDRQGLDQVLHEPGFVSRNDPKFRALKAAMHLMPLSSISALLKLKETGASILVGQGRFAQE